jgi:N-acetylglucosamine-6-phosphate deacetylase
MTSTIFTAGAIHDGLRLHEGAALVVEDGRVAAILPGAEAPDGPREDLGPGIIAPGFVDLQVNGGDGIMLDGRAGVAGIARVCAAHGRLGTTGLLPTLITDTPAATRAVVAAGIAAAETRVPGFLGLHLEGPHLDPRRKGAHDPALIRPMEAEDVAALCDAASRLPVLLVTLAPEAARPEQIAALVAAGAVVSLGHSDTGAEAARAAFAAGAGLVTHLFNAMSPLGHREPGLVGAALDAGAVSAGVIADGLHVVPEVLRIALAAKRGPGRLFLVTDAMAVAGTEATEFALGGRRILRRDGRLTLADGTLAGADCDMARCLRVLVDAVGVEPEEAIAMATGYPAAAIGLASGPGRLVPGGPADMVLLRPGLTLAAVWRGGRRLDA